MRAVTVVLVTATLVALAGCGGGRRSHGDFVRDAGDICREANRRFDRVTIVRPSAAHAEAALAEIVEIGAVAVHDLRRVKPPKGDETDVSAWLGAFEQALDELDYARSLLHDDEIVRALGAIARADVLTRRARVLGRRIGVARVCVVPQLLPGDEHSA
ncbi:MAG TPA: hypothetical protein VIH82_00580 [Acidimicrobiia bacterium]|jgi:hypothetical protein